MLKELYYGEFISSVDGNIINFGEQKPRKNFIVDKRGEKDELLSN